MIPGMPSRFGVFTLRAFKLPAPLLFIYLIETQELTGRSRPEAAACTPPNRAATNSYKWPVKREKKKGITEERPEPQEVGGLQAAAALRQSDK